MTESCPIPDEDELIPSTVRSGSHIPNSEIRKIKSIEDIRYEYEHSVDSEKNQIAIWLQELIYYRSNDVLK